MSNTNIPKRIVKGFQAGGYCVPTLFFGTTTFVLATLTTALAITGVGMPLALGTGYLTAGSAGATGFFGAKVGHKAARAAGNDNHRDHSREVASACWDVMSFRACK